QGRASSPRPWPGSPSWLRSCRVLLLFALALAADHFPGQAEVGDRAARGLVVADDALAVAGRFGQAHVARHDGTEDLVAEMFHQLRGDRVGQVVAHVEHGAKHAFDLQRGVELLLQREIGRASCRERVYYTEVCGPL